MAKRKKAIQYGIIIDTDMYAGNFERDLTAYCTGTVGECGVGDDYAELFKEDNISKELIKEIQDKIDHVADEHGCYRPCEIYPSIHTVNNGLGFSYNPNDELACLEAMVKNVLSDVKDKMEWSERKIQYVRDKAANWTYEAAHRETINSLKAINQNITGLLKNGPAKYPSYESVIIYFSEPISNDLLELIKTRAIKFTEVHLQKEVSWLNNVYVDERWAYHKNSPEFKKQMEDQIKKSTINILGFRVQEEQTTSKVKEI